MTRANTPRPWSTHEDDLLRCAVADLGDGPGTWKLIAERIPGRSNKACRKRWLHSLSPTIRKTPWTPAEDALLLKLYATHSPPRWSLIAKHIAGRTDDACSKRYREALDPLLKKDGWTAEEDAKLVQLTAQLGSRWTQVGQAMGRSGLGCRNRWRLLERKQRPRNAPRATGAPAAEHGLAPPQDYTVPVDDEFATYHTPIEASFPHAVPVAPHPLSHGPPPCTISTDSTLSGALTSAPPPSVHAGDVPESPPPPPESPSLIALSVPGTQVHPLVVPSSPPVHPGADPGTAVPVPRVDPSFEPPRKRPRFRGSHSTEPLPEHTRLSSRLVVDSDPTVLPYACGHPSCWPGPSGHGASRFATASELAEHRRLVHPGNEDLSDNGKIYRCALQGCGKGWKNINGIQYHLQISKAHFKAALSHTRSPPDASDAAQTGQQACASESANPLRKRKDHHCPHEGCGNSYKQRTGLQYHLAHGHPANVAQLNVIPPVLMRRLTSHQTLVAP